LKTVVGLASFASRRVAASPSPCRSLSVSLACRNKRVAAFRVEWRTVGAFFRVCFFSRTRLKAEFVILRVPKREQITASGRRWALCALLVAVGGTTGAAMASPPLPQASPARSEAGAAGQLSREARPAFTLSAEETAFRAAASLLVRPLLPPEHEREQADKIKTALRLITNRKLDEARALQAEITDPVARKLIDWAALRVGFGAPSDYARFLTENPNWPDADLLRRRMEQALFKAGGELSWIETTFQRWPPVSSVGLAAQASARLAVGDEAAAAKFAREAWCLLDLPGSYENDFLTRLGRFLSVDDHKCRLERLLVAHVRDRSGRAARASRMRPIIAKLPEAEQIKYTARLSMFLGQAAAPSFLKKVPVNSRVGDHGFAFQHAVWLRHRGQHQAAWRVLGGVAAGDNSLVNRDAWWTERRIQALNAIKGRNFQTAYDLVAGAEPDDVNEAKDHAFFTGWIALTYLRDPKRAIDHFERMQKLADGPLSLSMAEYWLGATNRRLHRTKAAREHFGAAARIRDTFHGLLAREQLGSAAAPYELPAPPMPTATDVEPFKQSELLRAAVLMQRLELDRLQYTLRFFAHIGRSLETPGQYVVMAQLARELGDGQLEVRFGKRGIAAGHSLYLYAYPVDLLPAYPPLREPVEPALILSIARQESEFNTEIVSRAGARGVLQVMPITARHICRQYKIPCKIEELLRDPVYNARVASAYIADRQDDFSGSYILTLTGYNAGPGRTRQWLRTLGDPRSDTVQPLDWIYRIPFEETRLYVQKVLSNVQVYRARLGKTQPLRLVRDMRRGRS
jgi:soluble lytic murein transglycosylase